jgi:thiamine pyrophosphate-dependent acetolactate synthase large subunit-like protein
MDGAGSGQYGSDVLIAALARLGVSHVAYNPGASFRGLHESLVHLDAQRSVVCLSEGTAVAIAHGYGKATGEPMAVMLHNLVGLQSGSMAIFNAFVDQVPMVVLGGSGPADRAQRRPWIDWIHSANPQGLAVRDWVKWDHEPTSLEGAVDALARAWSTALTPPQGPVYLALDALIQEAPVAAPVPLDHLGAVSPTTVTAPPADIERLADALVCARSPVIVADATGASRAAYDALIALSELLAIPVVDQGARHSFPNTHPADATARRAEVLAEADVVLLLDVRDPGWAIGDVDAADRTAPTLLPAGAKVFAVGLSALRQRSFVEVEGRLPPGAAVLTADTAVALPSLVEAVRAHPRVGAPAGRDRLRGGTWTAELVARSGPIDDDVLAVAAFEAVQDGPWQLAHGTLRGAVRRRWRLETFNAHLGGSGGAGLGYGAGATLGAGLAADDDTLVVSLQPDGDLLYTASALWTAAHARIPVLMIVVNNRCYAQDRMHQRIMARTRGRPVEHARVGIDLVDPDIDFATLARSQGVEGFGPVEDATDLWPVLRRAAAIVREERRAVLVDVRVIS